MEDKWQYLSLTRQDPMLTVQFDSGHEVNSLNNAFAVTSQVVQ